MKGNYYEWKGKTILAQLMRQVSEVVERLKQSKAAHQNKNENEK